MGLLDDVISERLKIKTALATEGYKQSKLSKTADALYSTLPDETKKSIGLTPEAFKALKDNSDTPADDMLKLITIHKEIKKEPLEFSKLEQEVKQQQLGTKKSTKELFVETERLKKARQEADPELQFEQKRRENILKPDVASKISPLPNIMKGIDEVIKAAEGGKFPSVVENMNQASPEYLATIARQTGFDTGNAVLVGPDPYMQNLQSNMVGAKQKFLFTDAGKALTGIERPIMEQKLNTQGKTAKQIAKDYRYIRDSLYNNARALGAKDEDVFVGYAKQGEGIEGKTYDNMKVNKFILTNPADGKQYSVDEAEVAEARKNGWK